MLSDLKLQDNMNVRFKNQSEANLNMFPEKILSRFFDLEPTFTFSYYKEFKAKLISTSEPLTIRMLDSSSSLYKANPSLAQTLFVQELLRLCSLSPNAVRIEDFTIEQDIIAYSTKVQTSLRDEYVQGAMNPEKEIEKLIKDISKEIQFLQTSLNASDIRIDLEKITKEKSNDTYYLKDWGWILNKGVAEEASNEKQTIFDLGLVIVELASANKEELLYLKQNKDSKLYSLALKGVVKGLPYSDRMQDLILRMIDKDPAARPGLSELGQDLQTVLRTETTTSLAENKAKIMKISLGKKAKYPFSAHGVVCRDSDGGTMIWGSGVLIGPNMVLTAAFNLWDRRNNRYYPKIKFIPGIDGDESPFGILDALEMFVTDEYKSIAQEKEDFPTVQNYGLLLLNEPIGIQTGYLGLHVLPESKPREKVQEIQLTGYSKKKPPIIIGYYPQTTLKGDDLVFDSKESLISYKMKTNVGQGGAGLYYEDKNKEYYVIGVHTTVHKDHEEYRSGSWIRKAQFEQIQKWTTQAKEAKKFDASRLSFTSEQNSEVKTQPYIPL